MYVTTYNFQWNIKHSSIFISSVKKFGFVKYFFKFFIGKEVSVDVTLFLRDKLQVQNDSTKIALETNTYTCMCFDTPVSPTEYE